MESLRKVYSYKPARIAIKFVICLAGVKIVGDLIYLPYLNIRVTFPRFSYMEGPVQSPLNPPIARPYPFQHTAQQVEENRAYDQLMESILENTSRSRQLQIKLLYNDRPQRENPDRIDYYLRFAESCRLLEVMQARALKKMVPLTYSERFWCHNDRRNQPETEILSSVEVQGLLKSLTPSLILIQQLLSLLHFKINFLSIFKETQSLVFFANVLELWNYLQVYSLLLNHNKNQYYSMEQNYHQFVRLQVCQKCYQHEILGRHSEEAYLSAYNRLVNGLKEIDVMVVRNLPPKYLRRTKNTRSSTKRFVDLNTNKVVEYPTIGAFEVYYKNILIFSKLQTSAFPDILFVVSIVRVLQRFGARDPNFMDNFDRFRDIEYELKRMSIAPEPLYSFIKMNSLGNSTDQCIQGILTKEMNSSLSKKKKAIHPYLVYDKEEKKEKIRRIYSPAKHSVNVQTQRSHQQLSSRNMSNKTVIRGKDTITHRQWTSRKQGSIVKNTKSSTIFQLVLQEGNQKSLDQSKLRHFLENEQNQLFNRQSFGLSQPSSRMAAHRGSSNTVSNPRLRRDNSGHQSQIYFSYSSLNNKENNRALKKPHSKPRVGRPLKRDSFTFQKIEIQKYIEESQEPAEGVNSNMSNENNKRSSSSIGSIKKNIKTNKNGSELTNTVSINRANTSSCFDNSAFEGNENLKAMKDPLIISIDGHKFQYKGLRYSSVTENGKTSNSMNPNEENHIESDNNSSHNLQNQTENQQDKDKMKRSKIQEQTVMKRINQRKRSTLHQRHSNCNSNFYVFKGQESTNVESKIRQKSQQKNHDLVEQVSNASSKSIQVLEKNTETIIDEQWKTFQQEYFSDQTALIRENFVQQENFCSNAFLEQFNSYFNDPDHEQVEFQMEGHDVSEQFIIKSIRKLCQPSEITLFPQSFKQIEIESVCKHEQPDKEQNMTKQFKNLNNTKFFVSKLFHLVNAILKSHPSIITRLFENQSSVNPYGVYCIWLKHLNGLFAPVFVNDSFPFHSSEEQGQTTLKPIYSGLNEGAIWFMLLEKAVAKVLGGYHLINQTTIADLMSMLVGSPVVNLGYITPQKAMKVFNSKTLLNKMSIIYTLRRNPSPQFTNIEVGKGIDRVTGFTSNKRNNQQSFIKIQTNDSVNVMPILQFIKNYGETCMILFDSKYLYNQTVVRKFSGSKSIISCRIRSVCPENQCYFMFSGFSETVPTKVTLYKEISDDDQDFEKNIKILYSGNSRYEYVGEFSKSGRFFFELRLDASDYVCIMENILQQSATLSILSEFRTLFQQVHPDQTLGLEPLSKREDSESYTRERQKSDEIPYSPQNHIQEKQPDINCEQRILNYSLKQNENQQLWGEDFFPIHKQLAFVQDNVQESQDCYQSAKVENQNCDQRKMLKYQIE